MPAPGAPSPLRYQLDATRAIVLTVPLAVIDKNFTTNGAVAPIYNPGGAVTATYTIAAGVAQPAYLELLDLIEKLQRNGSATVT